MIPMFTFFIKKTQVIDMMSFRSIVPPIASYIPCTEQGFVSFYLKSIKMNPPGKYWLEQNQLPMIPMLPFIINKTQVIDILLFRSIIPPTDKIPPLHPIQCHWCQCLLWLLIELKWCHSDKLFFQLNAQKLDLFLFTRSQSNAFLQENFN